jgi:hypothetical protein
MADAPGYHCFVRVGAATCGAAGGVESDDTARPEQSNGATPKRARFEVYPIGYFNADLAEGHAEEGTPRSLRVGPNG